MDACGAAGRGQRGPHLDRERVGLGGARVRECGDDHVADGRRALLDAAHNPAGARALAAWLARTAAGARPPLVFAAAADKDVAGMIGVLAPVVGDIVVTAFTDPRALEADALAVEVRRALAGDAGPRTVHVAATPADALDTAWRLSRDIVVAGSIFLLGEAYPLLGRPEPFARDRVEPQS